MCSLSLTHASPFRQECKKLREELREDHEEDKAAALAQLARSKEQELGCARESWQRKVEDLLEQVIHFVGPATSALHCNWANVLWA